METKQNKSNTLTLWQKLFDIQKSFKTFAISEDSDKQTSKGKPAYRYTPGWEIVENIRDKMDEHGLMLIQNVVESHSQVIEYPVYKLVNGVPTSFTKKEVYVEIQVDYTWQDVNTGESLGPIRTISAGANGTDKSIASALSLAERYFLLKFFRISTREKNDEPDAHDSDTVPGIPNKDMQPVNDPVVSFQAPAPASRAYPQQPQYSVPSQGGYPPRPDYGQMPPPTYHPNPVPNNPAIFNLKDPAVAQAAQKLSYFDKGTPTHQLALNEAIGFLNSQGICTNGTFIDNLVEAGQAYRENRQPNLK